LFPKINVPQRSQAATQINTDERLTPRLISESSGPRLFEGPLHQPQRQSSPPQRRPQGEPAAAVGGERSARVPPPLHQKDRPQPRGLQAHQLWQLSVPDFRQLSEHGRVHSDGSGEHPVRIQQAHRLPREDLLQELQLLDGAFEYGVRVRGQGHSPFVNSAQKDPTRANQGPPIKGMYLFVVQIFFFGCTGLLFIYFRNICWKN